MVSVGWSAAVLVIISRHTALSGVTSAVSGAFWDAFDASGTLLRRTESQPDAEGTRDPAAHS